MNKNQDQFLVDVSFNSQFQRSSRISCGPLSYKEKQDEQVIAVSPSPRTRLSKKEGVKNCKYRAFEY